MFITTTDCDTSGVHAVMPHSEPHSRNTPMAMNARGSKREDRRPPIIIAAMVPTPRGASTSPAVSTGKFDRFCSHGAISAELASSTIPTANISSVLTTKFMSLKIDGGMNGFGAVNMWTTNR